MFKVNHNVKNLETCSYIYSNISIMNDTKANAPKVGGPKQGLLLSSRQGGIKCKDQDEHNITILSNTSNSYAGINSLNVNNNNITETCEQLERQSNTKSNSFTHDKISSPTENLPSEDDARMNISKEDLIRLLSLLKSELQSKEVALAAIKCEQLKRLINPVEISRSSLANHYLNLQDRFRELDQNNNSNHNKPDAQPSCASTANQVSGANESSSAKQTKDEDSEQESLNILSTLLELLDRHPLLALPRDSIYCLDYNCNELSTKNYLNLKIHHLDDLISQHRRFRYYMNDRLKRSEQRYLDLMRNIELEKKLAHATEKSNYKASGKAVLLNKISQLKETLEKEKRDKEAIVMTLLNELLDERERSEALRKKLNEQERILNGKEELVRIENELKTLKLQFEKHTKMTKPRVPAKPTQLLYQQRNT